MESGVYISISIYFLAMLAIGWYSYRKTSNLSDYMLGGRSLGPAVTALSAGASDMSGWLLMGLPGALYTTGISGSWIAIGLVIGAYSNYLFLAPRLRMYTYVANDSITIPNYLENRFIDRSEISCALFLRWSLLFSLPYIHPPGSFQEENCLNRPFTSTII